jgi:peptidylprolyl isomerase
MPKQDVEFKIEDLEIGEGREVTGGDYITIHYKGTLPGGIEFDSSYSRGTPFKTRIGVGQVIAGWDMGVVGMKVGGKRKLVVPPQLAYGNQEIGTIPANSTLIFDLELLEIE